jgi:predicted amidophosphoribosyltransferase
VATRECHRPVLLVDDVATTGATLSAAATALRAAGVPEVHGLVVARALRPGPV